MKYNICLYIFILLILCYKCTFFTCIQMSITLTLITILILLGIGKVCDAVEVSGKNVMSTSSTVTTELVTHK